MPEPRSIAAPALCLLLAGVSAPALADGLVAADGGFTRDGAAYGGVGVNYYDGFLRHLRDGNDTSFVAGLQGLAESDIPFARFNAGGFRTNDWTLYRNDPAAYFERMDRFFDAAADAGVDLVPSLFWTADGIAALNGDTPDAWNDANSATRAFARQYAADVTSRYAAHPALLMWEFGNEFNLQQDLPVTANRPASDIISSDGIRAALAEFTGIVRQNDPTTAISSGHSVSRAAAQNLRETGQFGTRDTAEQFRQITTADHAGVDVLSVHAYYQNTLGNSPNEGDTATSQRFRPDNAAGYGDVLAELMTVSDATGKPLFVGEFGVADDFTHPVPGFVGEPTTEDRLTFLLDEIIAAEVPLSAVWVYDRVLVQDPTFNITTDGDRAYQLGLIADANRRVQQAIPEPASALTLLAGAALLRRRR